MFETRIRWNASSNISFSGASDWEPWDGDEENVNEVEETFYEGSNQLCLGLEMALEASGFDWWVEVREAEDVS